MAKLLPVIICINFLCASLFAQTTESVNRYSAQGNFSQYLNKTLVKNSTNVNKSSVLNIFNNEENTIGSRFLFNEWVEGDSIINNQGVLINITAFIFNYDKLTGNLLATQDKINNMLVSSKDIQSFVLKGMGKRFFFEHNTAIDSVHYFLELVKSDSNYSLYKRFVTAYVAANGRNDGVMQTGKDYNEYKDDNEYYVLNESNSASQMVRLKPKDIKAVFISKKDKTDAYFKQHRDDEINEKFLIGLIEYLNGN